MLPIICIPMCVLHTCLLCYRLHMCAHVVTHTDTHKRMHTHTNECTHTQTNAHMQMNAHTHTCTLIRVRERYVLCTNTDTQVCIHYRILFTCVYVMCMCGGDQGFPCKPTISCSFGAEFICTKAYKPGTGLTLLLVPILHIILKLPICSSGVISKWNKHVCLDEQMSEWDEQSVCLCVALAVWVMWLTLSIRELFHANMSCFLSLGQGRTRTIM